MVVEQDGATAILNELLTNGISTNGTFYVAEIIGESRKYGLDREFVTSKKSPYNLDPDTFDNTGVYEVKADDVGVRAYFQWLAWDDANEEAAITIIDTGDTVDDDAILDAVDSDTPIHAQDDADADDTADQDDETASAQTRALRAVSQCDDAELLETVAAMLNDDGSRDPGDHTVVDLGGVPDSVHDEAKLYQQAFAAAFERHTDSPPAAQLHAVALDAAVLAQKNRTSQ